VAVRYWVNFLTATSTGHAITRNERYLLSGLQSQHIAHVALPRQLPLAEAYSGRY